MSKPDPNGSLRWHRLLWREWQAWRRWRRSGALEDLAAWNEAHAAVAAWGYWDWACAKARRTPWWIWLLAAALAGFWLWQVVN